MSINSKVVGAIFARGGSKGLANKNIMDFGGKPLIAHAIEHALSVKQISRVVVSTDSNEIASIAREYGADVPFMRPNHLATDDSPEWLSWRHLINFIRTDEGCLPTALVSVPATAPLRLTCDIEKCINVFLEKKPDMVITITDAHRHPSFNMVKLKSDESYDLVSPSNPKIFRRQDASKVYDMTTVCFVACPSFVLNNESTFDGNVHAVKVPQIRSIDIDTRIDFEFAEYLFSRKNNT